MINAISIKMGGGVVVFTRTFHAMRELDKTTQWVVIIDEALQDIVVTDDRVMVLMFPWIKKSALHYLYWNEIYLPRLVKKLQISCYVSEINTLPFRPLSCSTFLSVFHAGYFSKVFTDLYFKYNNSFRGKLGFLFRKYWVLLSIKRANRIGVMTEALANEFVTQLKITREKVITISPGIGLSAGQCLPKKNITQKNWRIGYITKYGVQKNFDVLFRAAQTLKTKGIAFKLILTLDAQHAPFQHVNTLIQKYHIADVIENHGEISEKELQNLYQTLDLFIFPSICEAFGFTIIEAMHYGLPVIAADTESNREILGDQGIFFDAHNDQALVEMILNVMYCKEYYVRSSAYSIERSKLFSWEKAGKETLAILKELTCTMH